MVGLTIVCATDVAWIEGLCCSTRHVLRSSRSRGISRAVKLGTVGTHERSTTEHVVGTWARSHTARLNLIREHVVRTDTTLEVLGTFRLSCWAVCACETGILGSYSAFHIKLKKRVPSSYSASRCYTRAIEFRVRRSSRYSPGDGGNCQKFHSQQNWRHGGNRLCRNAPQYVVAALIHSSLIGGKVHSALLTYMSLQEVMQ